MYSIVNFPSIAICGRDGTRLAPFSRRRPGPKMLVVGGDERCRLSTPGVTSLGTLPEDAGAVRQRAPQGESSWKSRQKRSVAREDAHVLSGLGRKAKHANKLGQPGPCDALLASNLRSVRGAWNSFNCRLSSGMRTIWRSDRSVSTGCCIESGRDRMCSWIAGGRRRMPMTWVTLDRVSPSHRAISAWVRTSPASSCRCPLLGHPEKRDHLRRLGCLLRLSVPGLRR